MFLANRNDDCEANKEEEPEKSFWNNWRLRSRRKEPERKEKKRKEFRFIVSIVCVCGLGI